MTSLPSRILASRAGQFARQHRNPILAIIVLLVLTLFVSQNLGEASRISSVIQQSNPYLLGLALLANVGVVAAAGLSYRIVLGKLGHSQPWIWLANLHLKRHLVGTVTPVGGPASIYVFVRSLGKRGVQADDALFAATIRGVSGYAGFMMILAPVLVLARPPAYIFAGAVGLFVLLAALLTGILLILRESCNPAWLMDHLHPRLKLLVETARSHRLTPADFAKPFLMAVIHNALGVVTLYLSLLAVGVHYEGAMATAIIGYAIGNLFMIVAPVFQGVGVVEVTMAVALQQLGVPVPAAIAATILFRFCDLWFPFFLAIITHAPQVEQVRRTTSRMPAMMTAVLAVLVLFAPFVSNPFPLEPSVAGAMMPALAVLSSISFLVVARALWLKRPVGQVSALGAIVVFAPILAIQAPGLLEMSIAVLP